MAASFYRIREQLTALLLELPALATALEAKHSGADRRFAEFLERAERVLLENRLRQSADLAAIRADIAAARLGAKRATGRLAARLAALSQLGAARTSLVEAIERPEAQLEQGRAIVRQLLQVIAASGAIKVNGNREINELVQRIWLLASEHEQLKPLATQLRVLLDKGDVLLLLADEIDLADFS